MQNDTMRDALIETVRAHYAEVGFEALSTPYLEKIRLYGHLLKAGVGQKILLQELGLENEYYEWRSQHRPYRGSIKPTWTWDLALKEAIKLKEIYGDLPTLVWCRKNGYSSLGNVVFQSGHTWEQLREAIGCFATAPYRQSRNGMRWKSHPECCFSNFLYARGIEHKRGERYSVHNPIHTGHHCYDVHFCIRPEIWIDVEIWGDMPECLDGVKYSQTRLRKENWRGADENFLGIQYLDCFSDERLTKILEPYIGIIDPFIFDKPTDKMIQTAFWSDADDLLENCKAMALSMPDGVFPSEDWLRKRGKYKSRDSEPYNSMALRVNQWLGGTRNLRKILGHPEASTTAWTVESVIKAWHDFDDNYGVTPSQIKGRLQRNRFSASVFTEGCKIYEVARRLGALELIRRETPSRRIKWTPEATTGAWMKFVAENGRTPTECMSASQRQRLPSEIPRTASQIYGAAKKLGILEQLRSSGCDHRRK